MPCEVEIKESVQEETHGEETRKNEWDDKAHKRVSYEE